MALSNSAATAKITMAVKNPETRTGTKLTPYGDYLGIGAGAHGKISSGATGDILRRWKLKTRVIIYNMPTVKNASVAMN